MCGFSRCLLLLIFNLVLLYCNFSSLKFIKVSYVAPNMVCLGDSFCEFAAVAECFLSVNLVKLVDSVQVSYPDFFCLFY